MAGQDDRMIAKVFFLKNKEDGDGSEIN